MSVVLLGAIAHLASAEPPQDVDAATVRVFTIGTVGTDTTQVGAYTVRYAKPSSGHGTGFLVKDGMVMTAHHVVEGARHVVVRLPGDRGFRAARVAYQNKDADTAVLFVDDAALSDLGLAVASDRPRVREPVFAVGYPLDATRIQPQSARGIIAGFLDNGTMQVDMTLNPGNSGGPLVDEKSRVIGMVVARGDVESGIQGIGYAVPPALLQTALIEAKRKRDSNEVEPLSPKQAASANVVDEMVQNGVFAALNGGEGLRDQLYTGKVDSALEALIAKTEDADLLLYISGSMWNAALGFSHAKSESLSNAGVTPAEARSLANKLEDFARRAGARAVAQDAALGNRSAFVAVVYSGTKTPRSNNFKAPVQDSFAPPRANVAVVLRATMPVRANLATTSTTLGWGLELETRTARSGLLLNSSFQQNVVADVFATHTLAALDLGFHFQIARQLDISISTGPAYYRIDQDAESLSEFMWTARGAVELVLGHWRAGVAVRTFLSTTDTLYVPLTIAYEM